ncbi:MAG: hypothetical protein R3D27_02195 [Hyphomicrobiaceae bacterium]
MSIVKRPSILTFLVALLLSVAAVLSKAGVTVPVIGGQEFLVLLAGHVLLVLGCIMRGM